MLSQLIFLLFGYSNMVIDGDYVFSAKILKHPLCKEYVFEEMYFYDGERDEHILRFIGLSDYNDKKFYKFEYVKNYKVVEKYYTGKRDLLEDIFCLPLDINSFLYELGEDDGGVEYGSTAFKQGSVECLDNRFENLCKSEKGETFYNSVRYRYNQWEKRLTGGNICKDIKYSDDGIDVSYTMKEYDLKYCDNVYVDKDIYNRYAEIKLKKKALISINNIEEKKNIYKKKIIAEKNIMSDFNCNNEELLHKIAMNKIGAGRNQFASKDFLKMGIREKIRYLLKERFKLMNLDIEFIKKAESMMNIEIPALIMFVINKESEISIAFDKASINYNLLAKSYKLLRDGLDCSSTPCEEDKIVMIINPYPHPLHSFSDFVISENSNLCNSYKGISFLRLGNESEIFNIDVLHKNQKFTDKNIQGKIRDVKGEVYFIDGDIVKNRIKKVNDCSSIKKHIIYMEQ